ncbi:MAG: hypothetical protein ABR514_08535, partial [Chthoniobacterales bacterium]
PRAIAKMRNLPGIGKYTAHAVASFAFNQPVAIVEANTARVLARLFNLRSRIDSAAGQQLLWRRGAELLPDRNVRASNSALVDLGALVCLPRKPKCPICPVRRFCRATTPASLPMRRPRPEVERLVEDHAFIVKNNRILLEQATRRWRDMWILPSLKLDSLEQSRLPRPTYSSVFPFTHHHVTLRVFRRRPRKIDNHPQRWFGVRELESIPIPSPHRRAVSDLIHKYL